MGLLFAPWALNQGQDRAKARINRQQTFLAIPKGVNAGVVNDPLGIDARDRGQAIVTRVSVEVWFSAWSPKPQTASPNPESQCLWPIDPCRVADLVVGWWVQLRTGIGLGLRVYNLKGYAARRPDDA